MDRWELYVKAQELHDEGKWALVEDAEAELARLRAENEKLRADVVWAGIGALLAALEREDGE